MSPIDQEKMREGRARAAEERRLAEEAQRKAEEEEEERDRKREEAFRLQRQQQAERKERHTQLVSFVNGLYEENNKLSVKWPHHPVSELMLKRANRAIESARDLLAEENDQYLEDIQIFVPAGSEIHAEDATLALRMVKDALARMEERHRRQWNNL